MAGIASPEISGVMRSSSRATFHYVRLILRGAVWFKLIRACHMPWSDRAKLVGTITLYTITLDNFRSGSLEVFRLAGGVVA